MGIFTSERASKSWRDRHQRDGRIRLLVLQPTPFCNIDCAYCYLPTRNDRSRMSDATLERIFECVLTSGYSGSALAVVWHAGEPLVLPVSYYERAFAIIDRANADGVKIVHSFQTNGLLIDKEWIRFFKRFDVQLGLSLDGPRRLHDANRRTRAGAGTFDRAVATVDLLNRSGIEYHVITVVTADTLDCPDELFDFYVAHGIRHVGFNVEEIEGPHRCSSLDGEVADIRYRRFLARLLSLNRDHGGILDIREFAAARDQILGRHHAPEANEQNVPLGILTIGVGGEVSTFSPELIGNESCDYRDFLFGNIHVHDLDDVLADRRLVAVREAIAAGVEACRAECDYFGVCGGGAPANKIFENGSFASTETMFCRLTKKAVIDVVLETMEEDLGIRQESAA